METTNSADPKQKPEVQKRPFWPTSKFGRIGVGASIVYILFFSGPLGIIFTPILTALSSSKCFFMSINIGLTLTSIICLLLAKFKKKDKAISIIIALVLVSLIAVFGLLFLLGEVFIGHE